MSDVHAADEAAMNQRVDSSNQQAGNYVQAARERQLVREKFRHYVAPEIVEEILKQGTDFHALLETGGKKIPIAVLFVDVRGFTSMSERLDDPEKVVPILNRYLTLIARCILDNHGTLDKFVGDAAMAFWGAPMPQEDADCLEGRIAVTSLGDSVKLKGKTEGFEVLTMDEILETENDRDGGSPAG